MIEAKNIVKHFGKVEVLKGINVSLNASEIVSITGESGAGKTTLLHVLSSLDKPSSGEVFFEGMDISKLKGTDLARFRNKNIGFVFQFHQLIGELSALENVCLPAWIGGVDKKQSRLNAERLLDFLGLSHRLKSYPNTLSGGEQQRVAVARALINNPKIVFADEPTGNLDSNNALLLQDYFKKLRNEFNTSFAIVTHSKELAAMGDRIINLSDGKLC